MSKAYINILRKFPTLPLFEVCRTHFNLEQQQALLNDILTEKVEHLAPWVNAGRESYEIRLNTTASLALDALVQQDKEWLNSFTDFFENKLLESLQTGEKGKPVLQKIKILVEESRAGLTVRGITKILNTPPIKLTPVEDLELHLLMIKMWEELDDPERWQSFLQDKLIDRPWLVVALIYTYRNKAPFNSINILAEWDNQPYYHLTEDIYQYASIYLRHAIYNWLNNGQKDRFHKLRTFQSSLQKPDLRQLLEAVLDHELLSDIAAAYEREDQIGISPEIMKQLEEKVDNDKDGNAEA